jgi:outer membrane protein OmpA-like peptidoglycan-associated protein
MNTQNMILHNIKIIICLCLAIIVASSDVMAQTIKSRSDLDKKSLKYYKDAMSEGRRKNYEKSLELYEKVLKKHPDFMDAQLRKAGMLHNMGRYEDSAIAFEQAIAMAPEYDPQMYFSLAMVNGDLDRFDIAARNFQFFIDRTDNEAKKLRAIDLRDRSLFAHNAMAHPVPFNPQLLTGGINSPHSEYVPLMNIEGNQMVFTRRIGGQEDFYIAQYDGEQFFDVEEMYGLNTPQNEGVHTISADGKTIIFTACDRRKTGMGSCDLYYSHLESDGWSIASNMGKVINSISWDAQPSLSADGKKLFFSSNRQDGIGGNDIWLSTRTDTSGWTAPMPLSEEINTSGNEESPFIHPDGHTLYFRSNKHIGMGGYDIFFSRYIDSTRTWTPAKNIGYPINTEGSEGALSVSLDGKKAYFASDMAYLEDKANANLDIYSFDLYHDARPLPTTFVKATITDILTGERLIANYSIEPLQKDLNKISGISDRTGSFITSLPTNMDYAFFVEKEGYILYSGNFSLEGIQDVSDPFVLQIRLTPIPVIEDSITKVEYEPIILNNIFFESGSAILRSESDIEISRLAENLKKNKNLKIEIHGHTDNVGSEEDNLQLSEDRARSVMMALIAKGILPTRISSKGFGESKPIDTNETEAGRKNNRRTEFVVQ